MSNSDYIYIKDKDETLGRKINYSYSKFGGLPFLENWKKSRTLLMNKYASDLNNEIRCNWILSGTETEQLFDDWISCPVEKLPYKRINLLLKRFEVTKKIYGHYDENFRPFDKSDYLTLGLYIKFSKVLTRCYITISKLPYLNALLKANDILSSLFGNFSATEKSEAVKLFAKEIEFIEGLISSFNNLEHEVPLNN